ncbi:Butyrophilin subfamily 2 member A2 [Oryzias melastigma]|uniref:Butyrophilin subfamily 2 member A2 n=1 Tax=Oryzias melastigma TaxID=30732 RepID=A0A834FFU3_ORYME|nr:Butyrophilin subfamily 2 member A2 [Oryzias melastigma]
MLPVVVFLALLRFSSGSSADPQNITAEPGQDVTLRCKDPEKHKIPLLEWSKKDSVNKNLFVIRNGRPLPADQHESFKNRVFLKDSQMNDGDLSVVLENVTVNDTGTYECRVIRENDPLGSPLNMISTINLQVSLPPGDKGEDEDGVKDGAGRGLLGLIALPVLVVVLVVVLWIYRKKSRGFPAESSDKPTEDL